MDLGDHFESAKEWFQENPEWAGVAATFAVFGLFKMGGGNAGIFNTAGNIAKAGGAGLLLTTALNFLNNRELNLRNYVPDFIEPFLGIEPE